MFLVVLGLTSTLAYVAGRSITAASLRTGDDRAERAPVVVDPTKPGGAVVHAAATPAPAPVAPEPVHEVAASKPSPFTGTGPEAQAEQPSAARGKLTEPAAGEAFWQVGAIDAGMADAFNEYLRSQGFRTRMAPGNTPTTIRVLVGPLKTGGEIQETGERLEAAGFQHFFKKY